MTDLPEGFSAISGKRNPPEKAGAYYVLLRNGMQPAEPWPVARTQSGQVRWKWGDKPDDFDVIAVKAIDYKPKEGRQKNGSYE